MKDSITGLSCRMKKRENRRPTKKCTRKIVTKQKEDAAAKRSPNPSPTTDRFPSSLMPSLNHGVLISFSRSHRILVLALPSFFLLLVSLSIHQYSLPVWRAFIQEDKSYGLLLGVPRGVRSDDWAIEIPLMLSQLSHKPPFPVVNKSIGYGANQLAPFKVPVWHILTLFKPTTWGFFLGADKGLAWMWWSMVLGFFYAFFLLFMLISRNRFFISMMGSLLLLFSPFFQFWSMHKSEIPTFMALIFISLVCLTFSAHKKVILANGVLLGWFCGCFMLNFIYPPYQISLAYFLVFIFAGFIVDRYSQLALCQAGSIRLAGLTISLAIAVFATTIFYLDAREVINIMADTVYPGKRFSTGGDFEPWKLLSNTFLIHAYLFFKQGIQLPSLVNWADFKNICEYASFIFLFPFLILVLIARCAIARKPVDPLSLMIAGYITLLLVYMFLGFPDWLSKYSGFSRTPSYRQLMGLGIANIALLVTVISKPDFALSKRIRLVISAGWAVLLILSAVHVFTHWTIAPLSYLIATSLVVALASYFVLCVGYSKAVLAVLVALSVLSTGWFNPLVRGGSEIFQDSRLGRTILDIDAGEGGTSRWITFSPFAEASNIFRILGVNALDGCYPYPQFNLWKKLDPLQEAVEVYNRYGYALFLPSSSRYVVFSVREDDVFWVEINPDSDVFRRLGVTHCLVQAPDTSMFDQSPVLQRLFSINNTRIYKVVSR
jgi:hypothetical protein